MIKYVFIVTFISVVLAAPPYDQPSSTSNVSPGQLTRPTPINPNIPSDPRPADRITLINSERDHDDKNAPKPVQIPAQLPGQLPANDKWDDHSNNKQSQPDHSHHKRDSTDKPMPALLPALNINDQQTQNPLVKPATDQARVSDLSHGIHKRENVQQKPTSTAAPAPGVANKEQPSTSDNKPATPSRQPYIPLSHKPTRSSMRPQTKPADTSSQTKPADTSSQTKPADTASQTSTQKSTTSTISSSQHKRETIDKSQSPSSNVQKVASPEQEAALSKNPITIPNNDNKNSQHKRDIPVPVTEKPKVHPSSHLIKDTPARTHDVSTTSTEKSKDQKREADVDNTKSTTATDQSTKPTVQIASTESVLPTFVHPVPVSQIFARSTDNQKQPEPSTDDIKHNDQKPTTTAKP